MMLVGTLRFTHSLRETLSLRGVKRRSNSVTSAQQPQATELLLYARND